MKCAVFKGPYEFEIIERDMPKPGSELVLVKIMAAGICGSDMNPYTGKELERRQPGIVMGHEAAGVVEAVGHDVAAWKKGDRVALNPQIYCGKCFYCKTGEFNLCTSMLLIGSSKRKFLDGAMCEYLCISEKQLLRLPEQVGYEEGSMLDPVGNALRVVRTGEVSIGDTVVVIGCGTIGLIAIQTARLAGAAKVIAVSRSEDKLLVAKELGADICVSSMDAAAASKQIKVLTDGLGAHVVIDCAGFTETYTMAVMCCRKRGTVVALGYNGTHIEIPLTELIFNEIRLVGSTGFSEESAMVMEYLSDKRIKLNPIITHRFPLKEIKKGFDTLLEPKCKAIKVVIHPNLS